MANKDNPRTGGDFENVAQDWFMRHGVPLTRGFQVDIGIGPSKKLHKFDLGSRPEKLLIECKSHTWTAGGNSPSAKMSVWNEAMYYFLCVPSDFRKILFVRRSDRNGETLAQHYIKRYEHLIPPGVEIREYDPASEMATMLFPREKVVK